MDAKLRKIFNAAYSEEIYRAYAVDLEGRVGEVPFRLAESPTFFPKELRVRLVESAKAILAQLSDPANIAEMKRAVPAQWDTPGMDAIPNFTQIDFAIVREEDGSLGPRLIELQGFPSLTAFQVVQRDAWNTTLQRIDGLHGDWTCWFMESREAFLRLAQRTIVGDHDPREVILMDIDPPTQKTWPDFAATRLLFGVDPVCPTTLVKRGKQLFRADGTPVRRIYNRVVFDELERKKLKLPFDYRDELDVEWTPHPNWYWVWSKHSLPWLDHWSVPRATFVSDLDRIPPDLTERYVLKPLFSFAGGGVNVDPVAADIEAIPAADRHAWCVQEKISYEPALEAADGGGVKVEVRMMFLRPDEDAAPTLAQNLVRLSRGKMLGVDFNKDFTWVGSSIGLWRE
jgi:hypothetical protein